MVKKARKKPKKRRRNQRDSERIRRTKFLRKSFAKLNQRKRRQAAGKLIVHEQNLRPQKNRKVKSRVPDSKDKNLSKVEALITLGRERGYITYDEIIREFPTIEDNMLLLEEIYERFSVAGIDVLKAEECLMTTPLNSCSKKETAESPCRQRI